MKTILVVDDQPNIITLILDLLGSLLEEIKVLTASNGKQALEIVKSNHLDLVITDLEMPIMSGFDLLAYLVHHNPDTNVIIITGVGSPEIEDYVYNCGSFGYMEKPLKTTIFVELVKSALFPSATGHIKGVNLSSFLQLLHLERKTCTVKVSFKSKEGLLYFENGEIINARLENLLGEAALYQIFKWPNPEISLEKRVSRVTKTISYPLNFILMESAKKQDEFRRDSGHFNRLTIESLILSQTNTKQDENNQLAKEDLAYNQTPLSENLGENLNQNSNQNSSSPPQTSQNIIESIEQISLEQKIIKKWESIKNIFEDESICIFVEDTKEKKSLTLQGNDPITNLSKEALNILNTIFSFPSTTIKGSFEYSNNIFGVIMVWDKVENYVIIAVDGFANKNSTAWFPRKRAILEKAFLSD